MSRIQIVTIDDRPVRCRVIEPGPGRSEHLSALAAAGIRGGRTGTQAALERPLLLLHGLGCSADVWLPALRCLEQEYSPGKPVWAPDMPGYGCSPGPREALGIEALADWAARLLDTLRVPRAHVAGHSMGCQVALALARRYPERVGRLVLVGPTTGRRWVSPLRYAWGLLRDGACEPALYCRLAVGMCREMGLRRYWTTGWKMLADDPCAIAGEVTAPTLVICGAWDAVVPEAAARRLAEALPHGRFVSVPRTPHVVQYQRPRELARLLLDFLAEPLASPRSAGLGR